MFDSSGLLQVLGAGHTKIFSFKSQKTTKQRIFTSEKLELRTNKLVNQLNSLFHRKTSTVWFWQRLQTLALNKQSRKPPRSDLVRRLGALTGLHTYCTTTKWAGEPNMQTLFSQGYTSVYWRQKQNILWGLRHNEWRIRYRQTDEWKRKKGVQVRAPQHSQGTRSGTCCSCERARIRRRGAKMRSAFVAASQYL